MRILVTGGAGFIGSHVVDAACDAGHDVAVLDDLSTGRRDNIRLGVPLHEVDLRDRDAVFRSIAETRPEAVSHHAAQASVAISMREPHRDAEINIIGTINLVDACVKYGVGRFVFASTGGAIYGEIGEGECAREEAPCAPKSPYGISKLYVEHLLAVYNREYGLAKTILRYANVYGPRQDARGEAGVVTIFLDAALSGRALRVHARRVAGDEGCVRDYVYVSDVARANVLALEGKLHDSVLNVATGVGTTTRQLAEAIFDASGARTRLEYRGPRPGDLERSVLDPTRCRRVLGELVTLRAGLELSAKSVGQGRGPEQGVA